MNKDAVLSADFKRYLTDGLKERLGQTEGAAYVVGREFARAGQLAAQTSFDRNRRSLLF